MISVEESTEFVPHGRHIVSRHPKGIFGEVVEEDGEEWWEVWGGGELYWRGATVVCSRGGRTRRCYSLGAPVLQAVRVTFHADPSRPTILPTAVPEEPTGAPMPSVVVRDAGVVRVFTEDGRDFRVALQFAVRRCWSTKFGLLIEREGGEEEADPAPPVLFSLLHPLDDFTRVVTRQGGRLAEWTEQTNRLVFTSSEPSLAVSYNSSTEQHSVWRVRRATQQEAVAGLYMGEGGREGEGSCPGSQTPSTRDSLRLGVSHSPAWPHNSSLHSPHASLPSLPSRGATPSHSRTGSPLVPSRTASPLSSMANIVRGGVGVQSPGLAGKVRSDIFN